jgi:hypothetical protein
MPLGAASPGIDFFPALRCGNIDAPVSTLGGNQSVASVTSHGRSIPI